VQSVKTKKGAFCRKKNIFSERGNEKKSRESQRGPDRESGAPLRIKKKRRKNLGKKGGKRGEGRKGAHRAQDAHEGPSPRVFKTIVRRSPSLNKLCAAKGIYSENNPKGKVYAQGQRVRREEQKELRNKKDLRRMMLFGVSLRDWKRKGAPKDLLLIEEIKTHPIQKEELKR